MKVKLFTLPNILTLLNLLCGSMAVIALMKYDTPRALPVAFVFIAASAIFDFFDGFAARMLGSTSSLGVQLDSLADVVSFGLVPALVAYKLYFLAGGSGVWSLLILLIVAFSALRLARFNVDDEQETVFKGLPVPANALLIGSLGYIIGIRYANGVMTFGDNAHWVILAVSLVLACLLISPIRMFSLKFKGFGFAQNAVQYTFLAMSLVLVIIFKVYGISLAIILYILTSIILSLFRSRLE